MEHLKTEYVGTGGYVVGQTQRMILKAVLGSCVGVALYDSDAGVGGIIHLLLPEPVSYERGFEPKKYATTGLPVFIHSLYEKGASRKGLKACIAGGAFIHPSNEMDFSLDIGGRTTDMAKEILVMEGIQIEESETGGFFNCCLSLNMHNWESTIEPSESYKLKAKYETTIPSPEDITRCIKDLLPIPQVALRILRILDRDYDISEIVTEVRKDQVISAKTLKLCNSAMFARRHKIASIPMALVLLGQDLFKKLVVSAAVKSFFDQCSLGYSICKGGLFHHAVGTAIVSEKLAQLTGKTPPPLAYTAGLLHDIGKVVLNQYVASTYPLFYRGIREENNILDVEKKIFGIDHTQAGNMLAEMWSLPEPLAESIQYHHHPDDAVFNSDLTHTVHLADLLMSRFHAGLALGHLDTGDTARRLERIGLSVTRIPEIVDLVPTKIFGL